MGDNVLSEADLRLVSTVLDKKSDGQPIYLDWNAFDAVAAITEPQLKDVASRLLPGLHYGGVQEALREAIVKKRKQILAVAKEKVIARMLDECQRLSLVTYSGISVATKDALREYFKEADDEDHRIAINQITHLCFSNSPRWKEDVADEISERFGIQYDPSTVKAHENGKGNGFIEKIITKGLCNVRADLRSAQGRANIGYAAPRIKRDPQDAYDNNGNYKRKQIAVVSLTFYFGFMMTILNSKASVFDYFVNPEQAEGVCD